jgi:hypothetical protein
MTKGELMKRKLLILVALVALVCWLPGSANASLIESGSLTTPSASGIVATDGWSSTGAGFEVSWTINNIGGAFPYEYIYTVSNATGGDLSKTLSHIIIEISKTATTANFTNFQLNGGSDVFGDFKPTDPGNSNPNLPGEIYGIKFTPATTNNALFTFSFDSNRAPTDGNFYAKDGTDNGTDVTAWNTAFDKSGSATIRVPDTQTVVPLPGAVLLLGAGLARLVAYARRREEE